MIYFVPQNSPFLYKIIELAFEGIFHLNPFFKAILLDFFLQIFEIARIHPKAFAKLFNEMLIFPHFFQAIYLLFHSLFEHQVVELGLPHVEVLLEFEKIFLFFIKDFFDISEVELFVEEFFMGGLFVGESGGLEDGECGSEVEFGVFGFEEGIFEFEHWLLN